ncbi:MAG: hypothetical protein ACHQIL_10140 [Steroidobacterales bacterium]
MADNPEDAAPAGTPSRRQIAIAAGLIIAYAALSHYSNASPDARGLGAGLSLGPLLLIALFLVWRSLPRVIALLVTAGTGALLVIYWPAIERHYEWADLAQQCGVYALIAAGFARSLLAGHTPTCTQIGHRLHGELGPTEISYLRGATVAWAAFYALLAVAILVLYFLVPLGAWSMFVNFASFGLIALMALVDHAIRRRLLPRRSSGGILTALRQALIG